MAKSQFNEVKSFVKIQQKDCQNISTALLESFQLTNKFSDNTKLHFLFKTLSFLDIPLSINTLLRKHLLMMVFPD